MPLDAAPHSASAEWAKRHGLRPDGIVDLAALRMTPAQLAERRASLNCSELPILHKADPAAVNRLAEIKWGEAEPEDIGDQLAVQSGTWMEALILARAEVELGIEVIRRGEKCQSRRRPWLRGTLDAACLYYGEPWTIECKFFNPRYPLGEAIAAKTPQALGQSYVTGARGTLLIVHNMSDRLHCFEIPNEPAPVAELLENAERFWSAVQARQLPFLLPCEEPLPKPVPALRVGEVRKDADVEWRVWSELWLATKAASADHKRATDMLKGLVPDDKQRAFGGGVEVKVSKAGAKTVAAMKAPSPSPITAAAAAA